jgi:hypothetical protein
MVNLRRIKEKLKKAIGKPAGKKISEPATRVKTEQKNAEAREEVLGVRETVVEKAKFSQPEISRIPRAMPQDLPFGYGQDKIVLQVRDPRWLHAYWEVTHATYQGLQNRLGGSFHGAKRVLRVYDISQIIFDGTNAHRFFDIEVGPDANNWYIDTAGPGRSWCVDFGLRLPNGEFITIVRSNTVHTPLDGPSWITDEEWMIPDDLFARLYGMGFGLGRSSPVGKAWQERVRHALFSGVLASPSSPVKKGAERKFWLMVNTELIVYGATEPDAKVTVQGRPINLRPDGTFTLRFALPDGKQVIPVNARSSDNADERTITPIVVKETK